MLNKEVQALFDKPIDLEEVGRDQDSNGVFNVELGPVVLLDG